MTGGFIVFWPICGVIAAVIASAKNRNALGWLALGALFAPSVLIVAVLRSFRLGHRRGCGLFNARDAMQCRIFQMASQSSNAGNASSSVTWPGASYVAGRRGPDRPEDCSAARSTFSRSSSSIVFPLSVYTIAMHQLSLSSPWTYPAF
jgi:hypothetical protein